jgi:hypothetical protein
MTDHCCFRLQEIFGGNAVSDEFHIGRHVANLFVTQTYEGQSDIHSKRDGSKICCKPTSKSHLADCLFCRFDTRSSHNGYTSLCVRLPDGAASLNVRRLVVGSIEPSSGRFSLAP